jgi:hypothetical protein
VKLEGPERPSPTPVAGSAPPPLPPGGARAEAASPASSADGAPASQPLAPPPSPPPLRAELEPLFEEEDEGPGPDEIAAAEPTPEEVVGPILTPVPMPALAEPPPPAARAGTSRRKLAVLAVVGTAIAVAGGALFMLLEGPAKPARPPAVAVATAAPADLVAERIATADRRLAEGRLAGEDGALEHLLAAKALRPEHAGTRERLRAMADTLESLGARALGRGDLDEASIHLSAARDAAPDRESIRAKLDAVAKAKTARDASP